MSAPGADWLCLNHMKTRSRARAVSRGMRAGTLTPEGCLRRPDSCESATIFCLHGVIRQTGQLADGLKRLRSRRPILRSNSSGPAELAFCSTLVGSLARTTRSCFSKLIVPLQAEGYECIAAQYGLNSAAEDVALTKVTIGRVSLLTQLRP